MSMVATEIYPEINGSFSFEIEKILYSERSPFQKIEIVESKKFGRVLFIDGFIMLTERDEFVYHEMMAHVPLFVHPNPRRILVIGGGDGGTVRECLRHSTVEQVDLVEIDEMVTQACLQYLPSVANELSSERVICKFEDGVAYVKSAEQRYDVVMIDSTDPISVGEGLFTREFYRDCFHILNEDGILVNQSESPSWLPEIVRGIYNKLSAVFPKVDFYQAHIPTYPSGHWSFGFASKIYDPLKDFQKARYRNSNLEFRYYNEVLHTGAFALPTFFQNLCTVRKL